MEEMIVLPDSEQMHRCLLEVSTDPELQKQLYPLFLQHAGQEFTLHHLAEVLEQSMHGCIGKVSIAASTMLCLLPSYIKALRRPVFPDEVGTFQGMVTSPT